MEFAPWLMICLLALFPLMMATLIFLYLQATRTLTRATTGQLLVVQSLFEAQEERSHAQSVQSLTHVTSETRELMAMALTEIQAAQKLAMQTVDLSYTRALSGSNSQAEHLSLILKDALTLLATKDPIAYQMVNGASSLRDNPGTEPYAAMDEREEADLDHRQSAIELMMERMVRQNDVHNTGAAGTPAPAEFAGEDAWAVD